MKTFEMVAAFLGGIDKLVKHGGNELQDRHLNPRVHVRNIIALTEIHGPDAVAGAIHDAVACQAYSSQYIENILAQRQRPPARPGPLHLTRRADMLELDLPAADLTAYETHQSITPTQTI